MINIIQIKFKEDSTVDYLDTCSTKEFVKKVNPISLVIAKVEGNKIVNYETKDFNNLKDKNIIEVVEKYKSEDNNYVFLNHETVFYLMGKAEESGNMDTDIFQNKIEIAEEITFLLVYENNKNCIPMKIALPLKELCNVYNVNISNPISKLYEIYVKDENKIVEKDNPIITKFKDKLFSISC